MVKPIKLKSSKSSTASNIIGMLSDVDDDQVLPDSLRKLEIVSVYSNSLATCKTNNERHQNPFLTELSTANSVDDRVCVILELIFFYYNKLVYISIEKRQTDKEIILCKQIKGTKTMKIA